MNEKSDTAGLDTATDTQGDMQKNPPVASTFARNIFPRKFVFSDLDLVEFCELVEKINSEAVEIQIKNMMPLEGIPLERQIQNVRDNMVIEYDIHLPNSDSIQGLHPSNNLLRRLPRQISSAFISNTSFSKRTVKATGNNKIEVFLDFDKPSLAVDINNIPSNATPNRSVINIVGDNEIWVIAAENRLVQFFRSRSYYQPPVHGSGVYDYLLWFVYFPIVAWILIRIDGPISIAMAHMSTFSSVVAALYVFVVLMFLAQIIFKIIRRLFPPTEYYRGSRWRTNIFRGGFIATILSLFSAALYDLIKFFVFSATW